MRKASSSNYDLQPPTETPDWAYVMVPINVAFISFLSVLGGLLLLFFPFVGIFIVTIDIIVIYSFVQITKGNKIAVLINLTTLVLIILAVRYFLQRFTITS